MDESLARPVSVICSRIHWFLAAVLVGGLVAPTALGLEAGSADRQSVVDAHLHYEWNQAEVTSPEDAVAALRRNGVELAVVSGTPPHLALELQRLAPDLIVPIYSPYKTSGDWPLWQFRPELVAEVREGLQKGPYRGIGELHLVGGVALRWRQNPVLEALLALGAAYQVPTLLHMEFSRADPALSLCRGNPGNKLILAHAGGLLPPEQVGRILDKCPNVWIDLSARDPWRYVRHPVTDEDGRLLPEWEHLVLAHPRRVIIGSDPVWPVERLDARDEPDTGWERLGEFLDFHRRWASYLPPEVADRVLRENARELFAPASDPTELGNANKTAVTSG